MMTEGRGGGRTAALLAVSEYPDNLLTAFIAG